MKRYIPQIDKAYAVSLKETNSPERNMYISILNTYIDDINSFFAFVKICKKKNHKFDAKSISKIRRNNYFIENLTLVINLINTNYKTNPVMNYGCLNCEMICDFAGINYRVFKERAYKYVQKKADDNDYDVEDLLTNFSEYREYFKDKK